MTVVADSSQFFSGLVTTVLAVVRITVMSSVLSRALYHSSWVLVTSSRFGPLQPALAYVYLLPSARQRPATHVLTLPACGAGSTGWVRNSTLLILSEYVNKTEDRRNVNKTPIHSRSWECCDIEHSGV